MSSLKFPLREELRDPTDEAALQRVWTRVAGHRRRRRPVALGASLLAVAAAVALVLFLRTDRGPLRLADGRALIAVDAPADRALPVSLSDGSLVSLAPGARLEPLESSGSAFAAILARGSATFDVHPGGPRRWQIECGLATVEVLGTRFSCERSPGRLRVSVERGVVLVRGERIPDRVRRLTAGESLDVVEAPPAGNATTLSAGGEAPAQTAAPGADVLAESPKATRARAAAPAPPSSSWRELARHGRHAEAFAALGPEGIRREARRLDVRDLFALADVARLSGHPTEAVAPLERIVADFSADSQAALAAFALGRLELDALNRPARAAAALDKALALGVPRSLREDVRGRLVEAYARAGDLGAARAAAADYRREFPGGHYGKSIDRWLSPR
jgi:transmembrane sensor